MASPSKTLNMVLRGTTDANIRFTDLCGLLNWLGFSKRVRGSHHIFWREGIAEIINVQSLPGGKSKPYQVRQVRDIIIQYHLAGDRDEV